MGHTWLTAIEDDEELEDLAFAEIDRIRAEEAQLLLLSQLTKRFGPLAEDVRKSVEAISSLKRLHQLAVDLLTARSLGELGLA